MKSIVVIGSLNTDFVVHARQIPQRGETVSGRDFATFPGGKGANQAVAAAKLGVPVAMIGKVGPDRLGDELIGGLTRAGVRCEAVTRANSASGVALITLEDGGQNTIVVAPGANAELSPGDIETHRALIESAAMILLQLETPIDTVIAASRIASRAGVPVMLDPAPPQLLPRSLLSLVTWLTPNETEARPALGATGRIETDADAASTAEEFLAAGVANVALKMGERGSFIATHTGLRQKLAAFEVEAVDSTAAGDTYNAAFACAMLRGQAPLDAGRFAAAAAAISVTRRGAQPSMPTAEEVQQLLRSEA